VGNLTKEPKKKEELLKIWKDKKLKIENEKFALEIIQRLNYYRLSGYAKYFYSVNRDFITGSSFNTIYNLYLFDSELRKIVMTLTEEIELNFRSYVSSYIANKYGACAYLETKYFENKINTRTHNSYYEDFISIINKKKEQAKNKPYIKHYVDKYNGEVPIWVIIEILSFTDISKFIKNFKNDDRKNLLKYNYDSPRQLTAQYLPNSIQIICDVRNMCAHYEKIFNLKLINAPILNKWNTIPNSNLYDVLTICKKLINDTDKWNYSIKNIASIIVKYDFKMLNLLGFENIDWEKKLIKIKKD